MRATTRSTPKVSRATRAIMMFELSPLVTAATAPASRIPASSSRSRSNPIPFTVLPAKAGPRRLNASGRRSITATVCPAFETFWASEEPTRPQPTTTTCTSGHPTRAADDYRTPQDVRITEAVLHRGPDRVHRGAPPAPDEGDRAGGVLLRRHLVHRLRNRGDPPRPGRGRRPGRLQLLGADLAHRRDPARHRRHELPPDDLRLSEWGWLVHRVPGEPGHDPRARGGLVAPGRLRAHRGGVRGRRRRRHHVRVRRPAALPRPHLPRVRGVDDRGQPARRQGVWPALRRPHLRVHHRVAA